MSSFTILVGFGKNVFSDSELADEGDLIVECLTSNPNFLSPDPPAPTIQIVLTAYKDSRLQTKLKKIGTAAAKDEERDALEEILAKSARNIFDTCGDSRSKALSSGHRIKKDSHPVGRLDTPEYYHQENTANTSEVYHKTPAIPHADKYLTETTQTPPTVPGGTITNWFSDSPKCTTNGHTVGQPLWSRVTPLGTSKELSPSAWYKLDLVT